MSLRQGVSLVTGLCLLAGCATTHSSAALDNWKTRRDALLKELVAYASEVQQHNAEVQLLNREGERLLQHPEWPAVEAFRLRWEHATREHDQEAFNRSFAQLTDAQAALVWRGADLTDRGMQLNGRLSRLQAKQATLLSEVARLESDLTLLVVEQQEAAVRQERFSQNLQALGLSMMLMGQAFQPPAPSPLIRCTTSYVGPFANTNCY